MPRTESKVLEVLPSDEQDTINVTQKFGWNLLSSQMISSNNPNVYSNVLEKYGVDASRLRNPRNSHSRTEVAKLVFQRDLDLLNLNEIKRLESEYQALVDQVIRVPDYSNTEAIPVWSALACLILGWIQISFTVGLVLATVVGGGLWLMLTNKNRQLESEYRNLEAEHENRKLEVLKKAEQLL
jgi:hypothetical protein